MQHSIQSKSKASLDEAANLILKKSKLRPALGLVLGSGFGGVLSKCTVVFEVPYASIPGFPQTGVPGHEGKLCLCFLAKTPVVILAGRVHYYEGHSFDAVAFPIRLLAAMGLKAVLLTNAAGGIASKLRQGDFMVITDHINLMGANPLRGLAAAEHRFVDLSDVYDAELARFLAKAAKRAGARCGVGVYLAVSGPSYETPAEIRAFAKLGADAVGMSTVPEAIVARQCGMRVAGLSCITNLAAGRAATKLSHREVLEAGANVRSAAASLLENFAQLYGGT